MRILQINAVYKTKSTGRIVMEMHKYFQSKGIESYVAYATENTDCSKDPNVFRIGNTLDHKLHALAYRIDKMQGCHSILATFGLIKKIKKIMPDIIIMHNLHSNYINIKKLSTKIAKMKIPTVIIMHDFWFMTGGCYHYTMHNCYNWLHECNNCLNPKYKRVSKKKYLINKEIIHLLKPEIIAISKWVEGEAKRSPIFNDCKISCIYNWVNIESFKPISNTADIKEKIGVGNSFMILGISVGWSEEKGLDDMISIAKAMPEAKIVLVGNQIGKKIIPPNIITIPFIKEQDELAKVYSAADVFVNLSKQETFGLVNAEALACGTPIVVNNLTACPEFVTEYTGLVVKEKDDIIDVVKKQLEINNQYGRNFISNECRKFAVERFSMEKNLEIYINTLMNMCNDMRNESNLR